MNPNSGSDAFVTKPTSTNASRPLVITAGEPAGIGPELCLALVDAALDERIVIVADPEVLTQHARRLGRDLHLLEFDPGNPGSSADAAPGTVVVWSHPMPEPTVFGTPNPANSKALLDGLTSAVEGCQGGLFAGLVTAPLQKSAINDAGIPFTGHTEFLAELTHTPNPSCCWSPPNSVLHWRARTCLCQRCPPTSRSSA